MVVSSSRPPFDPESFPFPLLDRAAVLFWNSSPRIAIRAQTMRMVHKEPISDPSPGCVSESNSRKKDVRDRVSV